MASNRPAQGFEDFISSGDGDGFRKVADLTAPSTTRWPKAAEMMAAMKKSGDLSDTVRTPIQFLDPAYFDPILFFIQHRDRKELNFRLRYYYEYDPLVGNIIDLHSEFPLSDFALQCADSTIQRHFEDLKDRIELLPLLMDILRDYWLLGEAFPFGKWSEAEKTWDYFTLIPPEKVEPRSSYITPNPILVMQVDDSLKKLVSSQDPIDQEIVKMMDPDVAEKIQSQNYIVLPQWQVSHFYHKTSRTDLRGTSIVKRCLKDLMYKDKLRLLQFTFADRHMFPLKIFKLGNPQTGWIPNRSHFEMLRGLLISAANDPDFNIIFHHGLQVDYVGTKDKIENLIPHFEFVSKQIMAGLFANQALVHGEGATYSNANVSVRVLMHRYLTIRSKLELMVNNKIFLPVAKARGYWVSDTTGGTGQKQTNLNGKYRVLDLPKMRWNKLNLIDDTTQKQFIMRLRDKGEVPHKLISEIFDLEENTLLKQLKDEQGTVVDPVYIASRAAAVKDKSIQKQVLQGDKTSEWVFSSDKNESKNDKTEVKPRQTEPEDLAPQPAPEELPPTPTPPPTK